MDDMISYIGELTSIPGVSSQEDQVMQYMYQALSQFSGNLEVDTLGNIICHFPSKLTGSRKLMIFAHMDEIGFIVRKVDKDGFLRVERIGGVNTTVLPGIRVDILGEHGIVPGVVGVKSHHFMKPNDKVTVLQTEDIYLDIGARTRFEAEKLGVRVGCFVTYHSEFLQRPGGLLTNKAMDNRASCAILLSLGKDLSAFRDDLNWDVYLVACVQEEFNIRGVMPAVRRIKPDVSIGIDVTPSCDTPDLIGYSDVVINGGPALTCMNFHGRGTLAGVLPDQSLLKYLATVAEEEGIPYQREIALGVITENAFIVFEELGVSVANISIPTRYTHSPVETVSIHDIVLLKQLLFCFIKKLSPDTEFGKRKIFNN